MDKQLCADTAFLSNAGAYTSFSANGRTIRFCTPAKLERYTKVLKWDNGYIEVLARYNDVGEIEEYIDLLPILDNLYIDSAAFLAPIKEVRINYGER